MRRKWLLGGLVAGCALAIAGVAASAVSERTGTVTMDAGEVGTATARCPKGTEVISQGFRGDFGGDQAVYPIAARRKGTRAVKASAYNLGAPDSHLDAIAYCAKPKPGLTISKSDPKAVGSRELRTVTAKCPRGSEAVGGGSASPRFAPGEGNVYTAASYRASSRRWRVTAGEVNNTDGGQVVAFAYCDDSQPGLRTAVKKIGTPGTSEQGAATARCRKDERVRSGGFSALDFDPSDYDAEIYTVISRRAGSRGWKAGAIFYTATQPGRDYAAYAYCLS